MQGWPEKRGLICKEALPYYHFRDEMTVEDGIIFRGDRIVIPKSLRPSMKQRVHAGHTGINSCLRRARTYLYWPGMSEEIRQVCQSCKTCLSFQIKQPQQPLILHQIPARPWQKIGVDIFTIGSRNYLIKVDYYRQFFEIDYLNDITSQTIVGKLKKSFRTLWNPGYNNQ